LNTHFSVYKPILAQSRLVYYAFRELIIHQLPSVSSFNAFLFVSLDVTIAKWILLFQSTKRTISCENGSRI